MYSAVVPLPSSTESSFHTSCIQYKLKKAPGGADLMNRVPRQNRRQQSAVLIWQQSHEASLEIVESFVSLCSFLTQLRTVLG